MDIGGRRVSRGMLPLLAFHTVREYYRLERKPPVTAGLLAANTLIYLRPAFLESILPNINEVWFNAYLILKHRDLKRLLLSPFYHMNETHLVYNMLSLLWKGIQLETSMGSVEFASMVAALLTMSQGITLLLSKSLLKLFEYEKAYYSEYAVGFSGVLFGVSFLGHLGGILAGIVYLHLKRSYSGPNPLRSVVRSISSVFRWPLRRYFGRGQRNNMTRVWRCPGCTFDNSDMLSVCEMCGTGIDGSDLSSNLQNGLLSQDELRRRRVERFSTSR
ncbi:rhomboid-like protein 14, mitochondrial isoform X2 [Spinacia oleracea]|uniref:Rhomboid-like protein 14, mitochondrial isoform X2 n=1 Tax=Spinacia oleracea TaxID=3562 RepID=A0A9R0ISX2_SPIOL|nr:rhomboid-like protein 14, mitochondrial isoform X2 [Spinacia oleracea]